jgi:hypothetical protein
MRTSQAKSSGYRAWRPSASSAAGSLSPGQTRPGPVDVPPRRRARPGGRAQGVPIKRATDAPDWVQTSPRYPGVVALRFARVLRYREDRIAADADDLAAALALLT